MGGFWTEIDAGRREPGVTSHPFCERWASGELGTGELAAYASEYEHVVVAIAEASARAARLGGGELAVWASAEEEHVSLWRRFARATGWGGHLAWAYAEDPLPETVALASLLRGEARRGLVGHLVTLNAIEAIQAEVSATMLEGLRRNYRFDEEETEYFHLHARRDGERMARMRARLDALLEGEELERAARGADAVRRSFRGMLDGVQGLGGG